MGSVDQPGGRRTNCPGLAVSVPTPASDRRLQRIAPVGLDPFAAGSTTLQLPCNCGHCRELAINVVSATSLQEKRSRASTRAETYRFSEACLPYCVRNARLIVRVGVAGGKGPLR